MVEAELEYTKRLITNIKRLLHDAHFNISHGNKKTGLFLLICASEEFFKLEKTQGNPVKVKIPSHREKLKDINDEITRASDKLINSGYLENKIAEIMKNVVSEGLQQSLTTEQNSQLVEFKKKLETAKTTEEILDAFELKGLMRGALQEVKSNLENIYSDRVRNNCLYVDKNGSGISEDEIERQIKMYSEITSGLSQIITAVEDRLEKGLTTKVELNLKVDLVYK